MILVDTSVWIDHFRAGDAELSALLSRNEVLAHPCVLAELALGSLRARAEILRLIANLPMANAATHGELMRFIDARALAATGLSYVDAHLLAAAALTPPAALWTRDKALKAQAARCGLAPPARLK